jgi:hypothetical protein
MDNRCRDRELNPWTPRFEVGVFTVTLIDTYDANILISFLGCIIPKLGHIENQPRETMGYTRMLDEWLYDETNSFGLGDFLTKLTIRFVEDDRATLSEEITRVD